MLHVVLHQPEIPPNTGNVIRLCANTGAQLHLIEPLGFALDDSKLRRAGLDYHEFARISVWPTFEQFVKTIAPARVLALTTRGQTRYDNVVYCDNDALVFGAETRGLPQSLLDSLPSEQTLRLPMREGNRSLNLSNAVAVVVYEAWRQSGFRNAR